MAVMASALGQLRIGELSRRSGVSRELLRAWERRYGLLRPTRTEGGFRLYGPEAVEASRRVQNLGAPPVVEGDEQRDPLVLRSRLLGPVHELCQLLVHALAPP